MSDRVLRKQISARPVSVPAKSRSPHIQPPNTVVSNSANAEIPTAQAQLKHAEKFGNTLIPSLPSRQTTTQGQSIQTKLTVGAPGDRYEQEADRVAEQVMSMPDSAVQQPIQRESASEEDELQTKAIATTITPLVQREALPEEEEPMQMKAIQREAAPEEEEPMQMKAIQREAAPEEEEPMQMKAIQREASPEEEEPMQMKAIQREAAPEEDELQAKPSLQRATDGSFQADRSIESQLDSSKGGGNPLPEDVRSFMEPRFGADFSQVRVYTDRNAVQMNQDLNAQAFTHKQDIYYGAGKAPGKDALTSHELTHVVQQTGVLQKKNSDQPVVQLKCSACEREEAKVQRSPDLSTASQSVIQRWSLFGDDEDTQEQESEEDSGGVLDWVKDTASGAVDTVTQAGSDAYDWAAETGGAAVDTVTQAGSDAYDWAAEKGGAVVDTVSQAGSDAYNWAAEQGGAAVDTVTQAGSNTYNWVKETGAEFANALLEKKKASLLAQISRAMQEIAGQEFVYLTASQIATLNSHAATISAKSEGFINLPEIAAQMDATDSTTPAGTLPVSASTVEAILQSLQSSISAPFMSSNSDSDVAETDQSDIQRAAIAAPPLVGAGVGAGVGGPPGAVIGFIVGIIVLIVMLIWGAIQISKKVEDERKREREREEEKKRKKSKKCSDEVVTTLNEALHEFCDQRRSCSLQGDNCASATAKVAAGMGCVDGRTVLQQKCFSPGDPGYEDHMRQIAQASAALRNCIHVMHEKCGDR